MVAFLAGCVGFGIGIFIHILCVLFEAWVGMKVWDWYVADLAGWSPTLLQMIGLAFILQLLIPKLRGQQASFARPHFYTQKEHFILVGSQIADDCLAPLLVMIAAWLGHITVF